MARHLLSPLLRFSCSSLALLCLAVPSTAQTGSFGSDAFLYWAINEEGEIWRARLDGSAAETIAVAAGAEAVVADVAGNRLYWAELTTVTTQGRLLSSRLNGDDRTVILTGIGEVRDLELDSAAGKLYFTDATRRTLSRVNVNGTALQDLATNLNNPRGLALHLAAGHVYFLHGTGVVNGTLDRANLDGSAAISLAAFSPDVGDVEVDAANNRLYFAEDDNSNGLSWTNLGGIGRTVIRAAAASRLEIVGAALYFTDPLGTLFQSTLGGGGVTDLTPGQILDPATFDLNLAANQVFGVFWDSGLDLIRADLDLVTPNLRILQAYLGTTPHDVAVDADTGKFYVTDFNRQAILQGEAEDVGLGQILESSSNLDEVRGLVLDEAAGRLYWVDREDTPDGAIRSVNLDGSGLSDVLTGLDKPHDLDLDPTTGLLYWTEGTDGGGATTASIRRVNINGSGATTLISSLSQGIRGIAVDPVGNRIYWTDQSTGTVSRANLDGSAAGAIVSSLTNPHDVAVDSVGGKIYWTESINRNGNPVATVRRANLDGSSPEDIFTGLSDYLRDLTFKRVRFLFEDGFETGDASRWERAVITRSTRDSSR